MTGSEPLRGAPAPETQQARPFQSQVASPRDCNGKSERDPRFAAAASTPSRKAVPVAGRPAEPARDLTEAAWSS